MTCHQCACELDSPRQRKFCSRACSRRYWNARLPNRNRASRPRQCHVCGETYLPTWSQQRTCGNTCGHLLRYGVAQPVVWVDCNACGRNHPAKAREACEKCGSDIARRCGRLCRQCKAMRSARTESSAHWRRVQLASARCDVVSSSYVYERDGWTCQLCGLPVDPTARHPDPESASLDHVVPIAEGGDHSYANTQLAHLRCNTLKGQNRGPDQQTALFG